MTSGINYLEINKHSWNNRTDTHLKSDFYNLKNFMKGETSLNPFELEILGDVKGKSILHLQCHFGQDTISLNRLGAEVISSLLNNSLELKQFQEYNHSPYNVFSNMEEFEPKKFRIKHIGDKIPIIYSIVAEKKN